MHEHSVPRTERPDQEQGSRIGGPAPVTGSATIETFVVALPHPLDIGDLFEARHLTGRVLEKLTREEYMTEWSKAGFPVYGICRRPDYFYRAQKV